MTKQEQAQKVLEPFLWEPKFSKRDEKSALIRALKEVVNQLENTYEIKTGIHRTGMIFCADVLELVEQRIFDYD